MKLNKLINKISMALLSCFMLSSCSMIKKTDNAIRNEVVATYNNVKITRGEVEDYYKGFDTALIEKYGKDYKNNREYISKQLKTFSENYAQNQLLLKEFKDRNISTDEDINAEVDKLVASLKNSFIDNENGTLDNGDGNKINEEKLNAALKSYFYVDIEDYIQKQRDILKINKLVEDVTKDVSVTDEEAQKYYDEKKENDYRRGPGAVLSHILVGSEEEALKVKERIKNGEKYEDLASELNKDSTSKTGGSLGFIEYDSKNYDVDFLKGARNLKEGEISDPVKTQFGYHIIRAQNVKNEAEYIDFNTVKDKIKETILNDKKREVVTDFSEKLYKDNKLKIKVS